MGQEGMHLSKSIDNLWGYVGALNSLAPVYLEIGDIAEALGSLNEAIQMAKQADMLPLVYFGMPFLALAYLTAGAFEKATQLANELYEKRATLIRVYLHTSLALSAQVMIQTDRLSLAQRMLAEAFEVIDLNGPLQISTLVIVTDAQLQLALKNPHAVLRRMNPLVNGLRQAGLRRYLPESLWLQAKALIALDQPKQAHEILQEARDVAQKTGARRTLWQILTSQAEVEAVLGKEAEAGALIDQAREVISYIADHTGSSELHSSFLARPDVRNALSSPQRD
jgi:tetratricopeptide (TPR) repeat protein